MSAPFEPSCPVPFSDYDRVVLAHGGGGRVMQRLVEQLFRRSFDDPRLDDGHDGARLETSGPIAVTTDAFTVRPLFFPGGDIGSLAVHGTVNDLAACGARPRWMTTSFILEEGLPLVDLQRIVRSMAAAARACGVAVVAGDTKVVERGKGDGVFIGASGVGEIVAPRPVLPRSVRAGDAVLLSGPIGDHGVAVMLAREGLELPEGLVSDSASIAPAVLALIEAGVDVHCVRDVTRGGLASVLDEIASSAGLAIVADEPAIAVRAEVSDACELLGLDPLYVACEGRFVALVPEADAERALEVLRAHGTPARIGVVQPGPVGLVTLESALGITRILDRLSGEQLPRIC